MKELSEFDKIKAPQEWVQDAIHIKNTTSRMENKSIVEGKTAGKRSRKNRRSWMLVLAVVLLLCVIGAGTATLNYFSVEQDGGIPAGKVDEQNQDTFIVLLTGSDTDGAITENHQAESNILLSVNLSEKKIAVVATPRDAYVAYTPEIQKGMKSFQSSSDIKFDKLTYAGIEGQETTEAVLENLYGISIDYYVKYDFSSVRGLIDGLGEITVYSDVAFTSGLDAGNEYYDFVVGENVLNADQVLAYCRERAAFSNQEEEDVQRNKNQIRVVEAVINRLLSKELLEHYNMVFESISDMIRTDMSKAFITGITKREFSDLSEWTFDTYTVTGIEQRREGELSGIPEESVLQLDEQSIQTGIQKLKNSSEQ